MIASTSCEAYHSHSLPALQRKEQEVLATFDCQSAKYTREQLAARLGWKEASVCARANSLVAKRVLEECDVGKTSSGRSAKFLRLARKQLELL
jgi:hypothetical protein